jgi:hypothetical protein
VRQRSDCKVEFYRGILKLTVFTSLRNKVALREDASKSYSRQSLCLSDLLLASTRNNSFWCSGHRCRTSNFGRNMTLQVTGRVPIYKRELISLWLYKENELQD